MNTTNAAIEIEATGLGPGATMRIVCPTCQGGTNKAATLSVRRTESGKLSWRCWRDSCKEGGSTGAANLVRNKLVGPKPNPYESPLVNLDTSQKELLRKTIGWTDEHLEIARPRWADRERRFAFPVFSPKGARRGYVLRSYEGAINKARNHRDTLEPPISWYGTGNTAIIVEDIPSAVRASLYCRAVALCGTTPSQDAKLELAHNVTDVIWALDADALGTAITNNRANQLIFQSSRVLPLELDLKDMDEESLAILLRTLLDES